MVHPKFVIVVGTSAGGMAALSEFVAHLKPGMDAAVFVVMHLSSTGISDFLVPRLQPLTSLTCTVATDGALIEKGTIYIAVHKSHLLIKKNRILIGQGPAENRWRPSVDVLFRSAAAAYNTRTIGVVLTGSLDDGTAGMLAIKQSGGVCIVQDPAEAEYPDMPRSVLDTMEVDYNLPLAGMGNVIMETTQQDPAEVPAPESVMIESQIAERVVVDYGHVRKLGEKSVYACPDCGGGLWHITNNTNGQAGMDRYRCHIGHSYSETDLVVKQQEICEATLWVALRIMEERKTLLKKMEEENSKRGFAKTAMEYQQKATDIQGHVDKLKEVLFASQKLS